jgi:Protein of unknown function (DUF3617)
MEDSVKQFMLMTVLLAAGWNAATADPLNVRPGLWETTSTGTTSMTGTPMGPDAATLNAMTPEQRAQMEAAIKRQASGQPTVRTNQSCVTPEQVAKGLGNFAGTPSPRCTTEVLQKTPTEYHFRQVCSDGGSGQSHVEVRLHLDSPESATMTMDGVHTSDGRTVKMSHKAVSKWIGSDCGKVGKGSIPH